MYKFNVEEAVNGTVEWIQKWFDLNGKGCKAIVGISGGKDSSVVAALCVKALGKERVLGVQMPNGKQKDIDASDKLIAHLGIDKVRINIESIFMEHLEQLRLNEIKVTEQAATNLPARIRMSVLYSVSQSVKGRVANTCNKSENFAGWETMWGDAVGDFSPLSNFTVTEVRAMGHYLELPAELVNKVPIDGLATDENGEYITDESKLSEWLDIKNFTYERLDKYIRDDNHDFNEDEVSKLESLKKKMQFKEDIINLPTAPNMGVYY